MRVLGALERVLTNDATSTTLKHTSGAPECAQVVWGGGVGGGRKVEANCAVPSTVRKCGPEVSMFVQGLDANETSTSVYGKRHGSALP